METQTSGVPYNPANVGITGGTIDGSSLNNGSGIVLMGFKHGIPVIGISSGSIAANGAISAITALPIAYPRAWCYFPANAVATVAAAGFRYCTFSTTTAGIAFLDTWDGTGLPTIPTSPTAVTDGKGAYTGVTGTITGFSFTLPAGAMGANGGIDLEFSTQFTSSVGTKLNAPRFGGTSLVSFNSTTTTGTLNKHRVFNSGNAAVQVAHALVHSNAALLVAGPFTSALAIDTSVAVTVDYQMTRNTATDNVVLQQVALLILSDGT
jgi:hypothetical protein